MASEIHPLSFYIGGSNYFNTPHTALEKIQGTLPK